MATFSSQIAAGINDVDNTNNGGSWSVAVSSALNIGNPGAVTRNISIRFPNVTIPQGAIINSAKIRFIASATKNPNVTTKIEGVDEDNTAQFVASPEDTARTRAHTTANANWNGAISHTLDANLDTPDLTSIVQEIVDRGGWASGNAMAFWLSDNGSSSGNYISVYEYSSTTPNGAKAATLIIDYDSGGSPSVSPSSSVSPSKSPSASASPSSSVSPSPSASASRSVSPSPADNSSVLDIAKDGIDVLRTNNPRELKFSSKYGTPKYFAKINQVVQVDGSAGDFAGKGIYTHNLGKYAFAEVFVRVYIGSPSGDYEYCPLFGSGASVAYNASYILKENTIELFGEFIGVSSSVWNFDFLIFLYNNDLTL